MREKGSSLNPKGAMALSNYFPNNVVALHVKAGIIRLKRLVVGCSWSASKFRRRFRALSHLRLSLLFSLTISHQPTPLVLQMTVSVAPVSPGFDIFSFVTTEDVKAHLALLGAFHSLRMKSGDDTTWQMHVATSVAKFQRWARQLQPTEMTSLQIDLDILMVWHTYLLVGITSVSM